MPKSTAPHISWGHSNASLERVQEYLRQRKFMNRDLGTTIHVVHSDPTAEMVELNIADLEAVLIRLQWYEERR